MKHLLLAVALLVGVTACGGNTTTSPPIAPSAPMTKAEGIIQWDALLVNGDGAPAVVDGYKVQSTNQSSGQVFVTDVGNTTQVHIIPTLGLPDGRWKASVIAYNVAGNTPPSAEVCFLQKGGVIYNCP
jgi:hypothetical protein